MRNLIQSLEDSEKFISANDLTIGDEIGRGNFGSVHKGKLHRNHLNENSNSNDVAVKTYEAEPRLLEFLDQVHSIIKEASVMQNFDHPNLVKLIGIVYDGNKLPQLILPLMTNRNLRTYVKQHKPGTKRKLEFIFDIAKGMEYLAEQKFVHGDLAARNCLVDTKGNVFVSDFGLTKDIYLKGYYRLHNPQLAIRWMAPEVLIEDKFTLKSDVWSFAVTCFEILTK